MNEQTHAFLTISDVAARLDVSPNRVRRLIEDRYLAALTAGREPQIPEQFLKDDEPVPGLRGTLILLEDIGFSIDEAIEWVLADNDELGSSPIEAMRKGHKAPVRRAIQSLA